MFKQTKNAQNIKMIPIFTISFCKRNSNLKEKENYNTHAYKCNKKQYYSSKMYQECIGYSDIQVLNRYPTRNKPVKNILKSS